MKCDEVIRAIPWLLDDELEPTQTLELESHLAGCAACRGVYEHEGRLRLVLRGAGNGVHAPPALRHRIRDLLDAEDRRASSFRQLVPAFAAVAILAAFIWRGAGPGLGWAPEVEEAAARHARILPMDVVAADVGQVQSFFNDKLPFAVHVPRVTATPVAMLGGRVTQLNNRDAAYLRYDVPRGRLSVFVYEDSRPEMNEGAVYYVIGHQRVQLQRVRGFTVARWRQSGLVYSLVTDLPEAEFVRVVDFGER
jgi:mycothiol system anti-sigma-R factor